MTPISVQLYSLREASAIDFDEVLAALATIGYKGVEPFDLFGKSPADFKQRVQDLGMTISSSHYPWANRTDLNEVINVLGELGLTRAAGGFMPDDFKDLDAIKRTAEVTQSIIDQLRPAGLDLFLHNHYWEFETVDGRPAYHTFQELVPDVQFEIDTYWAANFGACDPAEEVSRMKQRTPLLHIKDGPLQKGQANVVLGEGAMDIPGVIAAADPDMLEWLIVEFDACESDMMTAVRDSYRYLTNRQLGEGNV